MIGKIDPMFLCILFYRNVNQTRKGFLDLLFIELKNIYYIYTVIRFTFCENDT